MRIVKGSTGMTRTTHKMATFMLATAIQPTQDQPNSMSDNVRQWSDRPTVPTVRQLRQFRQFRQCPTGAKCGARPTVARQLSDSPTGPTVRQSDSARQCPTVPTVSPTAPTVPTARAQRASLRSSGVSHDTFTQLSGHLPAHRTRTESFLPRPGGRLTARMHTTRPRPLPS